CDAATSHLTRTRRVELLAHGRTPRARVRTRVSGGQRGLTALRGCRPLRRARRSARSVRRSANRVERRLHHRRGTYVAVALAAWSAASLVSGLVLSIGGRPRLRRV